MNTMLLYPKLAVNGIRKNRRIYLPYILTCAGMIMMYYITSFLSLSTFIKEIHGGDTMHILLILGCGVMVVFSAIFLFYTFGPNGNGQARYSWFIWAIAGVLYGAVIAIVKLVNRAGK